MITRTLDLVCGLLLLGAWVWIVDLKDELALQEARYELRIAVMAEEVSQKDKSRAEAVAEAERTAREKLEKETARVASLAAALDASKAQIARERKGFDARVKAVSLAAARDCAGMSRDWVRLYNEALGLAGAGSDAGSQGDNPAGTVAAPGQTGPTHAGVQPDALATPEDVLAHARDYGGYCRGLEAQTRVLIKVAQ